MTHCKANVDRPDGRGPCSHRAVEDGLCTVHHPRHARARLRDLPASGLASDEAPAAYRTFLGRARQRRIADALDSASDEQIMEQARRRGLA